MWKARVLLFVMLIGAAGICVGQPGDVELSIEKTMGLEGYVIRYESDSGAALAFDEFFNRAMEGRQFTYVKDEAGKTAVIRLVSSRQPGAIVLQKLKLEEGDAIPPIAGTGPDGSKVSFEPKTGKYTVLSLFFSSCAPCIAEIPNLNRFTETHPEAQVIGVTFEDAAATAEFVKAHGVRFRTISSAKAWLDQINVRAYPLLILIDRDGRYLNLKGGGVETENGRDVSLRNLERWVAQYAAKPQP